MPAPKCKYVRDQRDRQAAPRQSQRRTAIRGVAATRCDRNCVETSDDIADPIIAAWGPWVIVSLVGGVILLASGLLFVYNLLEFNVAREPNAEAPGALYATAVHPPARVPATLNGFRLWNALVLVLMVLAYGYPLAQFFIIKSPEALVHRVDERR